MNALIKLKELELIRERNRYKKRIYYSKTRECDKTYKAYLDSLIER